jgi:hypothetical protein
VVLDGTELAGLAAILFALVRKRDLGNAKVSVMKAPLPLPPVPGATPMAAADEEPAGRSICILSRRWPMSTRRTERQGASRCRATRGAQARGCKAQSRTPRTVTA